MSEDQNRAEKLSKASTIIKEHGLEGMEAMKVVDEVVGKPDFSQLMQQKCQCACGKTRPVSAFPVVNTGVIKSVYNVCNDCRKEIDETAHLVCITCKATVGHMIPHKVPSTGFEFTKGQFYHIQRCGGCSEKQGSAEVLEHAIYCKKNNIPTKSDPLFGEPQS